MIGILLPMTAFGLMLQRPLISSTKPLSASGIGPRALRMATPETHAGLRETETLRKILTKLDLPEIAGDIINALETLVEKGREDGTTSPLSSLWEFDADLDLLQSVLGKSKLIRKRAQTWENVTNPNCDTSEQIEKAYEWSHEFFPNLRALICGSNCQMPRLCLDHSRYSAIVSRVRTPRAAQARAVLIQRFDPTATRSRKQTTAN